MIEAMLVGLFALALSILYLRVRRYRSVVRIPARRNDHMVCRADHLNIPLPVSSEGVDIPPPALGPHRSAFLVLDIAVTPTGHILDPSIDVVIEGRSYRQYFERGARGTRYLNLTPALQHSGSVGLKANHIRWKSQGSLMVFDTPVMGGGDTLVVAPHPDDSEIAAFGLYSQRSSWIVTVTCGERSPTDLSQVVTGADQQRQWLSQLRVWDSLTIPQLGGVPPERCLNLRFPDARLEQMHDSAQSWSDLVEQLRQTLERIRPETVVCPHPLLDPHHDHVFTSVALAEALAEAAHQPDRVLLYVVHANEVPLYPFGTADSLVSLPPWNQDEWVTDTILSHSLSEDTRAAKYFAVEASHDLRRYARSRPRTFSQLITVLRREIVAFVCGLPPLPTDFLRRAPRPNEIYYVVSVAGFRELTHRATRLPRH